MKDFTQCTEALHSQGVRFSVQCRDCGYEWKVSSFVEGMTAEICLVCGSVIIRSKKTPKVSI